MSTVLCIDPGDEHCGVAVFRGGEVVYTATKAPTDLYDWLAVGAACFGGVRMEWDVVVCESFRLTASKASAQIGSAFGTVEVIGVLREYCRCGGIEFVEQPPSIKRPTRAILKAHGVKLTAKGPHARDAEVHGWYYLGQQEREA